MTAHPSPSEALRRLVEIYDGMTIVKQSYLPDEMARILLAARSPEPPASPYEASTEAGRALMAWDRDEDPNGDGITAILGKRHWDFRELVLAIEREARAASASVPPLDVERLAKALEDHQAEDGKGFRHACMADCADEILAAYAAETPEQPASREPEGQS